MIGVSITEVVDEQQVRRDAEYRRRSERWLKKRLKESEVFWRYAGPATLAEYNLHRILDPDFDTGSYVASWVEEHRRKEMEEL